MISWCLKYTGSRCDDVIRHLYLAIGLVPNCKETWGHLAEEMISVEDYAGAFSAASNALRIKDSGSVYLTEQDFENRMSMIVNFSAICLGISGEKIKEMIT